MNEFENALDDCLRQLGSGRSSLGQCLARYPQYAAELRPLLETALRLQRGRGVRPSGAARDRTRSKVAEYIQSHPQRPRNMTPVPRLAFAMLVVVLAFAFASTAFAQTALPGQILYALKLSSERAWRAASPNPVDVDISLADRRADEILVLATNRAHAARDDSKTVEAESEGIAGYNDVLLRLADEVKGPDADHILIVLQAHQAKFSHAGIHV
ncbi:MAG: hypothetical protein ACM3MF_01620, partial [Anaerolineae bacterium]